MGLLGKIREWIRPSPKSPEELAAYLEAEQMKAELKAMRAGGPRVGGRGRDASN